ncbi:MAG: type II toxin-antitoxin system VapC family toxin, partial [Desulfohalobiaceae bacterium]
FRLQVVQPGHWIFEVAAVLARLSPETATRDIHELLELNFVQLQTPELLLQASELSIELRHHLFDTLYHAVALALPDTRLITADVKYFHKAKHKGCLTLLQDFAADSNLA